MPAVLDRRLSAAALAEEVRPNGDLVRARDLQLVSVAARRYLRDMDCRRHAARR